MKEHIVLSVGMIIYLCFFFWMVEMLHSVGGNRRREEDCRPSPSGKVAKELNMPITSIDQRQIEMPLYVRRSKDIEVAALGYVRELMDRIEEPFYFGDDQLRRIKIESVGRRYITINYVRGEDEQLIPRLRAASQRQLELL